MAMQFNVLRSLQIIRDGEFLHVSTAYKPRLLLAILLAHAGKTLSTDTLVGGLWHLDVPSSARRNLHQYIHRLRGALGAQTVPGHLGGYAIHTDPDSLDSLRFLRLAHAGADALAHEDHAIAAKHLREGLDLWQGRAFEGFSDCALIVTMASRLEQARLTAYEQLAEAELALGRSGPLVPTLTELVTESPFRENLSGLLMRALTTNGRQAEALWVFRRTRAALSEQLGIEPGPMLQALHQSILRGDSDVVRARTHQSYTR